LQYFIAESDCTNEEIAQLRRLVDEADPRKKSNKKRTAGDR
jgi:hypothetical protein